MMKQQKYDFNYSFSLEHRLIDLNVKRDKQKIINALNIHAQFFKIVIDEQKLLETIEKQYNIIMNQRGFSNITFHYLKSLVESSLLKNYNEPVSLDDFLMVEHKYYPMKLIRPGEVNISEVKDETYISCTYVLSYQNQLIISPFETDIIHNVWFDRNSHGYVNNYNNALAAGVMYFSKYNKELLFINNASGHYRIDLDKCMPYVAEKLSNTLNISNVLVSPWQDVDFKNSVLLSSFEKKKAPLA